VEDLLSGREPLTGDNRIFLLILFLTLFSGLLINLRVVESIMMILFALSIISSILLVLGPSLSRSTARISRNRKESDEDTKIYE